MRPLRKKTAVLNGILLNSCLIFIVSAFAQSELQAVTVTSENAQFRVSYTSKQEPIPLNLIHSWILRVENLNGQAVEQAIVTIDGGMPAHNHGLPTQPVATELGNGEYLVDGIKFSMTGEWEMWIFIQTESVVDKVKFELEL